MKTAMRRKMTNAKKVQTEVTKKAATTVKKVITTCRKRMIAMTAVIVMEIKI